MPLLTGSLRASRASDCVISETLPFRGTAGGVGTWTVTSATDHCGRRLCILALPDHARSPGLHGDISSKPTPSRRTVSHHIVLGLRHSHQALAEARYICTLATVISRLHRGADCAGRSCGWHGSRSFRRTQGLLLLQDKGFEPIRTRLFHASSASKLRCRCGFWSLTPTLISSHASWLCF